MASGDTEHEPIAGLLAEMAISESGLSQPFGGHDWPQKSGYEIRHEIYRTTKREILRSLQPATADSMEDPNDD